MEPSENNELPEGELDRLLHEWKAPLAPARLRQAVFPKPRFIWWQRFWNISIRVPLPVACCAIVLLAGLLWKWPAIQSEAIQNRMVQREIETPAALPNFQPVRELRPRIIKVQNAEN